MKKIYLLISLMLALTFGLKAEVLEPIKWSFSQESLGDNEHELTFKATIDEGFHLYGFDIPEGGPIKTSITFKENSDYTLVGEVTFSKKPTIKHDPSFDMELSWFSKEVEIKQRIKVTNTTLDSVAIAGSIEFMGCNDETCIPPTDEEFSFSVKEKKSLLSFFFIAFVAGLAALLTPCVFPMIPMTVSYFINGSGGKVAGRLKAAFFGGSIIGIYTIIGTLVAVFAGPAAANYLSTHWLPNSIFAIVFLIFAFSFFGMFEIVLPSWIVNKSDKQADKGGYGGAFFMATTLVLVSFSCTGPIVGTILVESAGGDLLKPIIGMFGFSLAFALPFTVFALAPQLLKSMPKSGGWLNSVKVVLGFIEIGFALKFISTMDQTYGWGILDREIYIAVWIVLLILTGFYLLGKLKFSHDSDLPYISVPRLMLSIVTFSFVVYLIPGMFGAPLKGIAGYLPPQTTHDFDIQNIIRTGNKSTIKSINRSINNIDGSSISINSNQENKVSSLCEEPKYADQLHLPHGLEGYYDLEQAKACARAQNKPILIDFTGHGCVNCREMEAAVWSNTDVLDRLENEFVILALYVDDKKIELPEDEWVTSSFDGKVKKTLGKKNADYEISKFNVNAQPYYVIMTPDEEVLVTPKGYDLNPQNFIKFLDSGIEKFKNR